MCNKSAQKTLQNKTKTHNSKTICRCVFFVAWAQQTQATLVFGAICGMQKKIF